MTAVTLPAALRRSAGWKALSAHARLVFIELLAGAVPDARLISRKTGVGEATVRRAFGDLSEAGFIRRLPNGRVTITQR